MKTSLRMSLAGIMALLCVFAANAAAPGSFAKPALITSIGQNSDAAIVKVLMNNKLKMGMDYSLMAKPSELAESKTVIMVVGSSAKGMGAAGINMDQEIARTQSLLDYAKQKGIKIILMHTGGQNRRGAASNQLIDLVIKDADAVIVVASGNADKYFDNAHRKAGVEVTETQTIAEAGLAAQKLFTK